MSGDSDTQMQRINGDSIQLYVRQQCFAAIIFPFPDGHDVRSMFPTMQQRQMKQVYHPFFARNSDSNMPSTNTHTQTHTHTHTHSHTQRNNDSGVPEATGNGVLEPAALLHAGHQLRLQVVLVEDKCVRIHDFTQTLRQKPLRNELPRFVTDCLRHTLR
jgi:hypothetical protein